MTCFFKCILIDKVRLYRKSVYLVFFFHSVIPLLIVDMMSLSCDYMQGTLYCIYHAAIIKIITHFVNGWRWKYRYFTLSCSFNDITSVNLYNVQQLGISIHNDGLQWGRLRLHRRLIMNTYLAKCTAYLMSNPALSNSRFTTQALEHCRNVSTRARGGMVGVTSVRAWWQ